MNSMKNMMCAIALTAGMTGTAMADYSSDFVPVSNAAVPALANYVTQDFIISTTNDWLGAQMIVELIQGSIYQDSFGTNTDPNAAFFGLVPSLEFDTYVTANGQTPIIPGGAVNLGGNPTLTFNTSAIDIAWSNTANTDIGTFSLSRLTFSSDAIGTIRTVVWTAEDTIVGKSFEVPIVNGAVVPEPASLGMVAAAGLMMLRRRR